jgi:nitrous oxidase accessory protein
VKIIINILLFTFIFCNYSYTKDIIVNNGESIKDALALSNPGDRIVVKGGYYNESGITLTKQVQLVGEGYPELNGMNKEDIIIISADGVTLSGFLLKNSGASSMKDYAAIKIVDSKNCKIESNKLYNNYFGIYLANSTFCEVTGNNIISNATNENSSGNGIHLWKCDNILIQNNFISGHRDGIYFEFVTSSKVFYNTSEKNIRYGLHFMFSNGDDYEHNIFRGNGAGVAVMYTKQVKMINNRFEDNWGANAYGLLLKDITDSHIYKNTFHRNTVGIYSEGGIRINILNNTFTENGWALKILGNCTDDTVKYNNFISNTFDVSTNSSKNANLFEGNYWDKYSGYDLDKDNIGDVPYRPVSMFSMIIENTSESIFLLRSFVVTLLDVAEKVAPVFIPETLIDEKPSMKPVV